MKKLKSSKIFTKNVKKENCLKFKQKVKMITKRKQKN